MNRELKFRGWSDGLFGKGMHYSWGCFTNESSKQFLLADSDRIMVNVLMQFTGLKDKNGKEIYEGDVMISYWNDGTVKDRIEVVFWEGCFCYMKSEKTAHIFDSNVFEIIGNIYENPELLTTKHI